MEQHDAALQGGGTIVLVQAHRNIHAPRPPYKERFPGLAPLISSAAFDLDSLTPNPSGSVKFNAFAPSSITPVTLDPGSAEEGWQAFLLDPGSYIVDFRLASGGSGMPPPGKLSALIIVPEESRLVYVGSFDFHVDSEKIMMGTQIKGWSNPPLKIRTDLGEAAQVASRAVPEFGPPQELQAVLYGSPLRAKYHSSIFPLNIVAYDPGPWMSPDLTAAWASKLAGPGLQVAGGGSLEAAGIGGAIALLGGAIGGVYAEVQEKAWEDDFKQLAQTLSDYNGPQQLQLELQSILAGKGEVQVGEVVEMWKPEKRFTALDPSVATLELLPLFFGFNTYGANRLATSLVVRVRFRPVGFTHPVFDQVLVYTQNFQSLPFFMIPVPSVGWPFPFTRLREPDAEDFLRSELQTAIHHVSDRIVNSLLIGGQAPGP